MDFNEVNAKSHAQQQYLDQCSTGIAGKSAYGPPSLREQAEKDVGFHRSQADKADRAAAFFRENPAFDEFIQLVHAGAIRI